MFTLELSPTYFWPVKFAAPSADGAKVDQHDFDVEFKRLDADELKALMKRAAEKKLSDEQVAATLVVGWRGVRDKGGEPVPYTVGNLNRLLNVLGLASAVMRAYFDSHAQAAEKN